VNKYILYTIKNGTRGLDTQVSLCFEVNCDKAPTRLADFSGGTAKLYDGYSTYSFKYSISLADYDERRICLQNTTNGKMIIHPEFVRKIDPKNPLNQLFEIPLKLNQDLSGYTISNSNWGLN